MSCEESWDGSLLDNNGAKAHKREAPSQDTTQHKMLFIVPSSSFQANSINYQASTRLVQDYVLDAPPHMWALMLQSLSAPSFFFPKIKNHNQMKKGTFFKRVYNFTFVYSFERSIYTRSLFLECSYRKWVFVTVILC